MEKCRDVVSPVTCEKTSHEFATLHICFSKKSKRAEKGARKRKALFFITVKLHTQN